MIKEVVNKLIDNNISISFAESCTGGSIASVLTKIPGVSKIFKGSFVTYSAEYKNRFLNVPYDVINDYGVVSKDVSVLMAGGLKNLTGADLCLSITGNCGPTSNDNHEVGLAFSTIIYKDIIDTKEYRLNLDRTQMIEYLVNDQFERINNIISKN